MTMPLDPASAALERSRAWPDYWNAAPSRKARPRFALYSFRQVRWPKLSILQVDILAHYLKESPEEHQKTSGMQVEKSCMPSRSTNRLTPVRAE